jgi:uncharacterized protein (TIGR02145 family)
VLLAGSRNFSGTFYVLGISTNFWSSTEYDTYGADGFGLLGNKSDFGLGYGKQGDGFSVRCVKD